MRFIKNFGSVKVVVDFNFTLRPVKEDMFLELSTGAGQFKIRIGETILKEMKEFFEKVLEKLNEIKELEKKELKLDQKVLEKLHEKALETLRKTENKRVREAIGWIRRFLRRVDYIDLKELYNSLSMRGFSKEEIEKALDILDDTGEIYIEVYPMRKYLDEEEIIDE